MATNHTGGVTKHMTYIYLSTIVLLHTIEFKSEQHEISKKTDPEIENPKPGTFSYHEINTKHCCILSGQIKGNTVPISAIWHRSSLELCHYLDTGIVWLKLPKAYPPPSNLKR